MDDQQAPALGACCIPGMAAMRAAQSVGAPIRPPRMGVEALSFSQTGGARSFAHVNRPIIRQPRRDPSSSPIMPALRSDKVTRRE